MTSPPRAAIVAADPVGAPNPRLVTAARRAGHAGLLDLGTEPRALADLAAIGDASTAPLWVRVCSDREPTDELTVVLRAHKAQVVVRAGPGKPLDVASLARWSDLERGIIVQVTTADEARSAVAAGATGLLASGFEAGGAVATTEAFVLFQHLIELGVPVWVRGGIGLHTAAGVIAGGAAGVVLDAQLSLTPESMLDWPARQAVAAMDGSETRVVGGHRVFTRPDLLAAQLDADTPADDVAARLGPRLLDCLLPIGQDGSFAAPLTRRFGTVGGILQGFAAAIDEHRAAAAATTPLAPGHGVAAVHGTTHPIAQGPMTRVSDRAEFALAVAEGGGLPFLALALLSGDDTRTLLESTRSLLGDRPWGVGILGFVPPEVRAAQLEAVHDVRPPFALIAGGRPSQAQPLESVGISTYLHVPSPGLLDRFLAEGARKFVFEGRECGGHVGPRSSLALWDAQLERLGDVADPESLQILLAGGIHDGRSAAVAATAAAPLVARGAKLGVLMGTAYLFTAEAITGGAIQPAFQDVALGCERTVLLETSPGHATRCVETNYVRAFRDVDADLRARGLDVKERWAELETLNLGRLRIAAKGLVREGDQLVAVADDVQRRDGMYMIGEVAALRHERTTVADLHDEVAVGSTELIGARTTAPEVRVSAPRPEPLDIAIVGMDSFLPGSVGADQFWADILAVRDRVTEVSAERWDTELYYDADSFTRNAGRKTPSKWGAFLTRIGFDPLVYGIPPTSLAAIEPVQLLSLEVAARALVDAGYATRAFDRSRASVIFGAESGNELGGAYGARAFVPQLFGEVPPELDAVLPALTEDSFPGVLTNVIAGRIANRLDLGGVNYTIDAACASSLAALDAACKELRTGVSDLVVCGGADLHNGLNDYLMFASVHALSPTGRCRTFDRDADGIALGEGIACVVLKRRVDAERDGDRIYAVVDAVSGSSDGRSLGLTAPRKEGQQRAVRRAWAQAGVRGSEIGLVEAHGTGTVVGDRTELATLTELFEADGAETGGTVLGSVKSQIGHTKCAAGLAGIIKVAKALHHGVLPPTANLVSPNDAYDAEHSPFRFIDAPRPWPAAVRRGAVSAFGFGGTNFHTVLSSHPDDAVPRHGADVWPAELFVVRAADSTAAQKRIATVLDLVDELDRTDPDGQRHRLRDLAAQLDGTGRGPVQVAVVADSFATLAEGLRVAASGASDAKAGVCVAETDGGPGRVAFLYPGQGSQRPGMLNDLFVTFPWLGDLLVTGDRWAGTMLPPAAHSAEARSAQVAALTATDVAQPALGMASLAMTRLLRALGIEPDVAGGHSYGELAALAAAGCFDDATLLALSAARGESILTSVELSGGDPGTMAAVELSRDELAEHLGASTDLVIANHNGPRQTVISGATDAVESAVAALKERGVRAKPLNVACAFHSPLIAMAGKLLGERLEHLTIESPTIPVWSNVTGEPYPADADRSVVAQLLTEQVTNGVQFVDQIISMYEAGVRTFIETGPGRVLTAQVGRILGDRPHRMVATDASGESGVRRLLLAVAELATAGVEVDLKVLFAGRTDPAQVATWPHPAPGWIVDGAFVRTADGSPLPNSLRPATDLPRLHLGGAAPAAAGGAAESVVLEYLQNVRQLVAAERDVMLGFLGAAPAAVGRLDGWTAPPLETTGRALESSGGAGGNETSHRSSGRGADRSAPPSGDDLLAVVLGVVAQRTGYPVEMLDPDADLEADLSIDSIKRIEIIGELAGTVGLAEAGADTVGEAIVEELAQLKTLRSVVAWIDDHVGTAPEVNETRSDDHAAPTESSTTLDEALPLGRWVVDDVSLDFAPGGADLTGWRVRVIGADDDVRSALESACRARGATTSGMTADDETVISLAALQDGADARTAFVDVRDALEAGAARVFLIGPAARATGVRGLARSLAREYPERVVRAVELNTDASGLVERLLDDLADPSAPVTVCLGTDRRSSPALRTAEPDDAGTSRTPLDADAVIVLTGGARGITARLARRLAIETGAHLVLVGRTPMPGDEDAATADLPDRTSLRAHLIAQGTFGTPAAIEAACNRILADREVHATLADLAGHAAGVEYHSLDVRDPAFAALLDDVRARHGRLDGIVHGAGVLDDRFARDKSAESFDHVFGTKVEGARSALAAVDGTDGFVVLFGSVSGVFGNRGQTDYAAANDALDALAAAQTGQSANVVSIDWGPWGGGGMITAELEREYARRGIGLIQPDEGVDAVLAEINRVGGPAQVVVMAGSPDAFNPESGATVDRA